jgi:hypothetical protein
MARHTKEWNEGYQAAIEAIKKAMQGGGSGDGDGDGLPSDMTPPPSQGGSGSGSGKGKGKQQNSQGGQSGNSRTSSSDPNQGVVRPEDCEGGSGVGDIPGTPGGFFSKEDGDKLAQSEGYDKEGGGQDSVERSWKDSALKATQKLGQPGDVWGKLKSTIERLYKTTTDWKAAFKFIVGKSLNDAETRSALEYRSDNVQGPPHMRVFTMSVYLDGIKLGTGIGKTKKDATQEAAKSALQKMARIN